MGKVCSPIKARRYSQLFNILHSRPFKYSLALDENRESDGEDLRYRFGYERDFDQTKVAFYLDRGSCSVLEMLVAMAVRMDDIMYDEDPGVWFWDMMDSLGLSGYTNGVISKEPYAEDEINGIIDNFMERDFDPNNGEGSPFTVKDNRGQDLRNVEFWCLAMWHATEVSEENGVI